MKIVTLIIITIAVAVMGVALSYLWFENRIISNAIDQAYSSSDKGLHDQGLSILSKANSKWMVNTFGINRSQIDTALSDIEVRNEHEVILKRSMLLMDTAMEEQSIALLKTIPKYSFYYQKAQTNIQKAEKFLLKTELSRETKRRQLLEEQLRITEHKLGVEKSAKEQQQIERKQAEEATEYQRLRKEEQTSAKVAALADAEVEYINQHGYSKLMLKKDNI